MTAQTQDALAITDLFEALTALPIDRLRELRTDAIGLIKRSALKREIAASGRSLRAYAMLREYTAKRRVQALLRDAEEMHPETLRIRAKEAQETWAAIRAQNARRAARAAENRKARERGYCPRCQGAGYIPNVIQDGAVCYRCNGTGR